VGSTVTVARPALAPVLHALAYEGDGVTMERVLRACSLPRSELTHKVYVAAETGVSGWHWQHDTTAEAWEALSTAGVIPADAAHDSARGFLCGGCNGSGTVPIGGEHTEREACPDCAVEDANATGGYELRGWRPIPSTMQDLVSVTSLGWEAVLAAESLARETCARLAPWRPWKLERVIWWPVAWAPYARNSSIPPAGWPPGATRKGDRELAPWVSAFDATMARFQGLVADPRESGLAWGAAIAAGYSAAWTGGGANPYEPLHALYNAGLSPHLILHESFVIACPAIGGAHG
jgi:hypothetical protein